MRGRASWHRRVACLAVAAVWGSLAPRASAAAGTEAQAGMFELVELAEQAPPQPAPTKERDKHTSFLRWVHVDGLWVPGQTGAGMYGLIGVHLAVARVGRMNFFGPPGVMLVRQNTTHGRMTRAGFTWGFGYELTEMTLPGTSRPVTVFLTMAKCWTAGTVDNGLAMFGLSVTWVK